ncbi:hypothetical protein [Aquibacillus sediminis]|nr:hypothetical protein [Aquibacillus sediminis]
MFNLPTETILAFFPWPILFIGSAFIIYFIFKKQDELEDLEEQVEYKEE